MWAQTRQPGLCYEGRGLSPKKIFFAQNLSNLGTVLNKLMQLKRVTEEDLGVEPQP